VRISDEIEHDKPDKQLNEVLLILVVPIEVPQDKLKITAQSAITLSSFRAQ
jgi:hypothetical protein